MRASLSRILAPDGERASEILSVSDEEGDFIELPCSNALLAAVHLAFSQHRRLCLSPDMIWLTILQGFARHVRLHAAELESQLMLAPGRHTIVVHQDDSMTWPEVFAGFAKGLSAHTQPWAAELLPDFTTTGPVERTAAHVALMDVFASYVQYVVCCVCGIPEITLEGCVEDWSLLRCRLGRLRGFGLDDWIDELEEVIRRFVDAMEGRVDRAWWQQIYKVKRVYGGDVVEGWMGCFFPYLKHGHSYSRRRVKGESFRTDAVPPGVSEVALELQQPRGGKRGARAVAGMMAVEELSDGARRPKIAWSVLQEQAVKTFVDQMESDAGLEKRAVEENANSHHFPTELQCLYAASNGLGLYGRGEIFGWGSLVSFHFDWVVIGRWDDQILLYNDAVVRAKWSDGEWQHQTLALCLGDFLLGLMKAKGEAYWEQTEFSEPTIMPQWKAFTAPVPHSRDFAKATLALQRVNQKLRSKKQRTDDIFVLSPTETPTRVLPQELQRFYQACGSFEHKEVCRIWRSEQVYLLPHTSGRWWVIGNSEDGDLLLLDVAGNRGVALYSMTADTLLTMAGDIVELLEHAAMTPGKIRSLLSSADLWPGESLELLKPGAPHQ
jgi:hypothetical protein